MDPQQDHVQSFLQCPICKLDYASGDNSHPMGGKHLPRFLQCGHTFCSSCLYKICTIKKTKALLTCPTCEKQSKINVPKKQQDNANELQLYALCKLIPNLTILRMKQGLGNTPSQTPPHTPSPDSNCENCLQDKEETVWCENCTAVYCTNCFKELHQNRVMSRHSYRPLTVPDHEQLETCEKHNCLMRKFCFDEKKLVCEECLPDHVGHKIAEISKAAEELCKSMKSAQFRSIEASTAIEELKKRLDTREKEYILKGQKTSSLINERYEALKTIIDRHRTFELGALAQIMYTNSIASIESTEKLSKYAIGLETMRKKSIKDLKLSNTEMLKNSVFSTGSFHKALSIVANEVKNSKELLKTLEKDLNDGEPIKRVESWIGMVNESISQLPQVDIEQVTKLRNRYADISSHNEEKHSPPKQEEVAGTPQDDSARITPSPGLTRQSSIQFENKSSIEVVSDQENNVHILSPIQVGTPPMRGQSLDFLGLQEDAENELLDAGESDSELQEYNIPIEVDVDNIAQVDAGLHFSKDLPDDMWTITNEQAKEYRQLFDVADIDHDGFIGGSEAVIFFQQTGLPTPILSQIWELADHESEGCLDLSSFSIAMHILMNVQKYQTRVPKEIPEALLKSISFYFDSDEEEEEDEEEDEDEVF